MNAPTLAELLPTIEIRDAVDPRSGRAFSVRVGSAVFSGFYEVPPQSWKRFQLDFHVRVYDEGRSPAGE